MHQRPSVLRLQALLAAQKEINNASKDAKNPHFRSSYASLGSVIEAIKEPCNKHGIVILQTLAEGETGLHLSTRAIHSSGQWIEDLSNLDTKFTRNYIRNEMMSHVLRVNPGIHKMVKKRLTNDIKAV